jgi:predicted ATP-dependent protease
MLEPLDGAAVRPATDPAGLGFASTAELPPPEDGLGQRRATRALSFGLSMAAPGYNVFVLGAPETDRRHLVDRLLAPAAAARPTPDDTVYLHDFAAPDRPRAVRLPAGRGRRLRRDAERLVDELRSAVPAVFADEAFGERLGEIASEFGERQKAVLDELRGAAAAEGLALVQTPSGFAFAPATDGRVMERAAFEALDAAERQRLEAAIAQLTSRLLERMQALPLQQQEMSRAQRSATREFVAAAVGRVIRPLRGRWAEVPAVIAWLDGLEADAVERAPTLLALEQQAPGPTPPGAGPGAEAFFARWRANLLVDHADGGGAPVVHVSDPTLEHLCGRIDHRTEYGTLLTDATLIRAGALHRANGGYLVVDAERILARPFAWDALKRALLDGEVRVEHPSEQLGFGRALTLDAEPLALDVKVVLLGQRRTYYLLAELDPDFPRLFRIPADLEDRIVRDADNATRYARLIGDQARREGLRPLDAGAVARILDHAVRLGGDAGRLSAHTHRIGDLVREADQLARDAGAAEVAADHVEAAVAAQIDRLDRIRADVHERIAEGTVRVALTGAVPGQVNALSVLQIGEAAFGQPARVTATARPGRGGVVDIEREARLGGAIHSKAVMILAAFVGARYAAGGPPALAASLVFEQSYGGIDGDSATVAEVCALLSAIAGVPLRQDLALTGSMDQHGNVQAVGGVNEKIEGFFDVCAARDPGGRHGVLIPADNRRHLMLRADVAEAVDAGRFTVETLTRVDDALERLTGLTAADLDARVVERLAAFRGTLDGDPRTEVTRVEAGAAPAPAPPGPPPGPEDQR